MISFILSTASMKKTNRLIMSIQPNKLLGQIPTKFSESALDGSKSDDNDSTSSTGSPVPKQTEKASKFTHETWYAYSSLKIISNKEYPDLQTLLDILNIWGDFYCGPQSLESLYTIFYISLGLHIRQVNSTSHSYIYESAISDRIQFYHNFKLISDVSKTFTWTKVVPYCKFNTSIRFECTLTPSNLIGKSFRMIHKSDYNGKKTIPSLKPYLKQFGIKVKTHEGEYYFET